MSPWTWLAVASLVVPVACAPRVHAAAPPAPLPAEAPLEGDAVALRGYLGRSLIEAELVVDGARFRGCSRELGTKTRQRIDGTLGAAMPAPTKPSEEASDDSDEHATDSEEEGDPVEFDCRFDARSDLVRLGSVVARCLKLYDAASNRPSLQIDGKFFGLKGEDSTPFYLAPATYPGTPDELLLAFARAESAPHACVPFIEVLDVKTLPGERKAVLYARDFPCEHQHAEPGEEPAPPAPAELRLALFAGTDPARPHVVVVPGSDAGDTTTLAVYELGPGVEIFEIRRTEEVEAPAVGRSWSNESRSLFALGRGGRPGPVLELPEHSYQYSCEPTATENLLRVELDGDTPPELVVESDYDPAPCNDGGGPPEPHDITDVAYGFDPDMVRFVQLSVDSAELQRRKPTPLEDVAKPDDTWRAPRSKSTCTAPNANSGAATPAKP